MDGPTVALVSGWTNPPLPSTWSTASRPTYVGRAREQDVLETAWASVERGARQAVLVGGEPGSGKSRLIAEAGRALWRAGAAVLVGGCVAELGPPYQPFDEPVEVLRASLQDGSIALDSHQSLSARTAAARLGTLVGSGRSSSARPEMNERRDTYDALVRTLEALSRERPVVLALEDFHWAGSTSLQLLRYIIERTADMRLLLLATHRTTAPDRSDELVQQFAATYRLGGVQRLDLEPLQTEDIADFLVAEGGLRRERAMPVAVVLRDRTGGNPFFLRELWLDLAKSGDVAPTRVRDQPAPEVVRDTVANRTAGLTADEREALEVAAIMGEVVEVAELLSTLGHDGALGALDAVVATGLLQPIPGPTRRVRFTHALTRLAVLELMSASRRAAVHQGVAESLEARDGPVQQLAHHFAAAHVHGQSDKAVLYLHQAATIADRGLAHADAAALHLRAAGLTADRAARDQHLVAAAHSYLLACDFRRSRELYLRVATEGDASNRLSAATAYENCAWYTGESGRKALELLNSALEQATLDPHEANHIRALAGLGRATANTGRHEEAEVLVTRAIDAARAVGSAEVLADALSASVQVGISPASRLVKLPRARELSELAVATGQWLHLGPAAYHRMVIAYMDGDRDELAAARRALQETAEASGHQFWTYLAGCADYGARFLAADFDGAALSCQGLLELGDSFGDDTTDGPFGVQSFMVRRENGGLDPIRALVTGEEQPHDHWAPALLALYTELEMRGPCARLLQHVLDTEMGVGSREARWPATLGFACEAAMWLRDSDAAKRLRPLLDEYAGTNLVMGPFVALFGSADRFIAGLDSLTGSGDPTASFSAALALDIRTQAPLHQAHTLAAWAAHARRVGDESQVRALAAEARAVAHSRRMVRVLRLLDQAVGEPGAARPAGLTERETEVLRLLGEGLSNREISRRLTISENTAANHVRNILIKTGCANRTKAAMFAVEAGLMA